MELYSGGLQSDCRKGEEHFIEAANQMPSASYQDLLPHVVGYHSGEASCPERAANSISDEPYDYRNGIAVGNDEHG
jgi:hypothetical protein